MTLAITPLLLEFTFLSEALVSLGYQGKESQLGKIRLMTFEELNLCIGHGGHGKVQFAIQTQFLLQQIQADQVFCVGAAGGISKEVSIFDVIVGEKTIEHDYTCKFINKDLPEFQGNSNMLKKLKLIKTSGFNLHFGVIASGDEDIVDSARANEIQKKTNGLAVAWEGAGGARACSFLNIPFVELRAITDMASNSAPIDFKENLKLSMKNIAEVFKSRSLL